jgi:hypothetical protein
MTVLKCVFKDAVSCKIVSLASVVGDAMGMER